MKVVPQTNLGSYKILSPLGSGGMGEVFLAEDTVLERKVAIKCLPEKISRNSEIINRFRQEAKTISALNHPNIITIHEIGEIEGTHFIATEFIKGKTLRDFLLKSIFPLEKTISISIQITKALAAAHNEGIIHRDIKPENIMIRDDGYVKILDFGIAKLAENKLLEPKDKTDKSKKLKTETGKIMGTFSYMSPEQANGEAVDGRSDIFSFGILLYEMLTGKLPFEGETPLEKLVSIIHNEPKPLDQIAANIPETIRNICKKTLNKEPLKRFQTSDELVAELKSFKEELRASESFKNKKIEIRKTSEDRSKQQIPNLEENELLLTDFINLTGDEIFDKTLKLALSITLSQSPSIKIIDEKRIQNALKLMGHTSKVPVDEDLGREVCLREGLKAYITGTIANLGEVYMLTLEAFNAATGEPFGRQLEQAESKEKVLECLGRAATGIRKKLGESLSQIEKFDVPLKKVTTNSLEALKYFSHGKEAFYSTKFLDAIAFFDKAVALDPKFASAYTSLASAYNNLGEKKLGTQNALQAYQLKEHVSEFEKLRITSSYFSSTTGEVEKAIEILKIAVKTYPLHITPRINLSHNFSRVGEFEKSLREAREAFRLDPKNLIVMGNLISALMYLNRYSEAKEVFKKAAEVNLENETWGQTFRFEIAFVEGDKSKMQHLLDLKKGKPDEYIALNWLAQIYGIQGQIEKSNDFADRSIESAKVNNALIPAGQFSAQKALRLAIWNIPDFVDGKCKSEIKSLAKKALSFGQDRVIQTRSGLALALSGEKKEAGKIGNELIKNFPKDTLINKLWIPCIKASFYLFGQMPEQVIEKLEVTKRFERAAECVPQYFRGLAYLGLDENKKALNEFQKIIINRGEASLSPIYPLAQLGLARASRKRKDYENFLELWKFADENASILIQAKKELNEIP